MKLFGFRLGVLRRSEAIFQKYTIRRLIQRFQASVYCRNGYQVLKKWLSYRDQRVLGRPLHNHEVRTFMHIARCIAAILALEEGLDEKYAAVKVDGSAWG